MCRQITWKYFHLSIFEILNKLKNSSYVLEYIQVHTRLPTKTASFEFISLQPKIVVRDKKTIFFLSSTSSYRQMAEIFFYLYWKAIFLQSGFEFEKSDFRWRSIYLHFIVHHRVTCRYNVVINCLVSSL